MIDDHILLLTQILDEMKQQNQYLFDIRKRLESLEAAVGKDRAGHEGAKDNVQVRGN